MSNPFKYGGVVGKASFCNRKQELADLSRAMENGDRLFLYSARRLGKTSLVKLALSGLPKKEYLWAYVDLWPTDGEASFAAAIAKAITESLAGTADKMLGVAKSFFGGLAPIISADSSGNPQISFSLRGDSDSLPELLEVLKAPAEIAKNRKRKVVLVLDEFQRILEYGTDNAERTLRSAIQDQENVSYIFLGSRKHLIQKMFLDQNRPLYRAGGHYPLGPIAASSWKPFIQSRFTKTNKGVSTEVVQELCETTGGHPFYTQHLCHAVWELCEHGAEATSETIIQAIDLLLDRESYAYTALWESFAVNQRRFLSGLVQAERGVEVFGSSFIKKNNLKSASSAQRVVENLLGRDIIDREEGSFFIADRFFHLWVKGRVG
jgi:uncharacterized protein